jgi:hypothetical protein
MASISLQQTGGAGSGGGSGTVTSVSLSLGGSSSDVLYGVTGTPITTSGTLALSLATQVAGLVFAGPATGSPASPTFRALVSTDVPTLNQNTSGSAGSVPWSGITAAGSSLTLANGTYSTTFQQTSNTAWLWQNTTAGTSLTTNNSPLLELAANYYTSGGSSAQDTWSIGSVLAAGANGTTELVINHSGSSGQAYINFELGGTSAVTLQLQTASGNTNKFACPQAGTNFAFYGNPATSAYGTILELQSNIVATSGTTGIANVAGTFAPTSGTGNFVALAVSPTIDQTSSASGNYTALLVNSTETAVLGANPSNKLLDLQVGGTSKFTVNNKGHVNNPSADFSGQLAISSSTTGSVTYGTAYTSTPTVIITPVNPGSVTFTLTATTSTGFTVTASSSGTYTVNYIVIGNPS